jgi:hypothetical protein
MARRRGRARQGFAKEKQRRERGRARQTRRDEADIGELGARRLLANQKRAERRPGNESEADGRAQQPHVARARLRVRQVGGGGERGADIAGHQPAEQARRAQFFDAACAGEPEIRENAADEARDKDGFAPDPIAEPPPERRRDQLPERISAHRDRRGCWRGAHFQRQEREDRQEHAKSRHADQHDADQRGERESLRLHPREGSRAIRQ